MHLYLVDIHFYETVSLRLPKGELRGAKFRKRFYRTG